MITQKLLKELFEYKDGDLYWLVDMIPNKTKGNKAGRLHKNGYFRTSIAKKLYTNHRLIFLYHYGYLPKFVDHIDGNKLNNKIENLREATISQNAQNSKKPNNNKSGVKGVDWSKIHKKWRVQINVDGKQKYFGTYFDLNVAKFVADTMRYKYHGQFARNN